MVRTRWKLAAALTVVVLALTGFETGSGGKGGGSGKSKSRSSDGGGCSSDKKDNDDYQGSGWSGDGGSGSGSEYTAEPAPSASGTAGPDVTVVDCVEPARKKRKGKPARKADTTATLRFSNPEYTPLSYRVVLEFRSDKGSVISTAETTVALQAGERKDVEVPMGSPGLVDRVASCTVGTVQQL
ncbi:hypothetical protein [Streptomyces sp. NPDC057854]|uniref:hypothetical protein n=1 Tax=unclassified Streptomyces TaxID=2593676 RepID=UPI003698C3DA